MYSEESENTQIIGNTIANFTGMLGSNNAHEETWGNLVIRDNNLVGHWFQPPLNVKGGAGKGSNVKITNNNIQVTVDSSATLNKMQLQSGVITGNTFNISYDSGGYNYQSRDVFFVSPRYGFYPGTCHSNKGLGNVVNSHLTPLNYRESSFKAEVKNNKVNFVADGTNKSVEYAVSCRGVLFDYPLLTKGLNIIVWGVTSAASTDSIRMNFTAFNTYDNSQIAGANRNITTSLSGVTPGTEFIIMERSVGEIPSKAFSANDIVLRITRFGGHADDTFAGDVAIHHITLTMYGSSE
jgi:hypothetical protein